MVDPLTVRNPIENLSFFLQAVGWKQHDCRLANYFLRSILENFLSAGIPARDDTTQSFADNRVVRRFHDLRIPDERFLCALALTDIANEAGKYRWIARSKPCDGKFNRKLGTISPHCFHFNPLVEHRTFAR